MKKHISQVILSITVLFGFFAYPESGKKSLRIATYNIRRKGSDPELYLWKNRSDKVAGLIKGVNPDIICLQEPVKEQIDDLLKSMPSYGWVGKERSSGIKGWSVWHRMVMLKATDEFNPIFYNKNRITVIEHGTFGIDTGRRIPQHTKDLPRICTWASCEDKQTGKRFYVYNTHLDNKKETIRSHQIAGILEDIKKRVGEDDLCFLMGDFNTTISGDLQKKFSGAGFIIAREDSESSKGPQETRTGWNDDELKVIDHILMAHKTENEKISHFEVVESPKGAYPSDHRPVFVDITFGK